MLPDPSNLARTKLAKGNKLPYLPVCTNLKGPRQHTALKGPAPPCPCVLTIRVSSRRSQHTGKRQPQLVHSSCEGDLESAQVTGSLAQAFLLLYRRLVPRGDDGLNGHLVDDVAVGPCRPNFQASTSNMPQRSASRKHPTCLLLNPCAPFSPLRSITVHSPIQVGWHHFAAGQPHRRQDAKALPNSTLRAWVLKHFRPSSMLMLHTRSHPLQVHSTAALGRRTASCQLKHDGGEPTAHSHTCSAEIFCDQTPTKHWRLGHICSLA